MKSLGYLSISILVNYAFYVENCYMYSVIYKKVTSIIIIPKIASDEQNLIFFLYFVVVVVSEFNHSTLEVKQSA